MRSCPLPAEERLGLKMARRVQAGSRSGVGGLLSAIDFLRRIVPLPQATARESGVLPPFWIRNPQRIPYGPFQLAFELPARTRFTVLASAELKLWQPIESGRAPAETLVYVDAEASKFKSRFYRVIAGETASTNIVGYVSITLPSGRSLIGNPFASATTSFGELFKGWPDGTSITKFDARNYRLLDDVVTQGRWSNPAERLAPGEGLNFFNPTSDAKVITFVGDVVQGTQSVPIAAGFSLRCAPLPIPGALDTDLGFPIGEGDVVHLFDLDRQKHIEYPFMNGRWAGPTPVVGAAEAFWIAKAQAANWTQALIIPDPDLPEEV